MDVKDFGIYRVVIEPQHADSMASRMVNGGRREFLKGDIVQVLSIPSRISPLSLVGIASIGDTITFDEPEQTLVRYDALRELDYGEKHRLNEVLEKYEKTTIL
jgi:hypothetical protein